MEYYEKRNKRKALVLSISIFLYCIATFSLPYMTEVLRYEEIHAVMIWATLCTIATVIIVYFFVAYPKKINSRTIEEDVAKINKTIEEIDKIDNNKIKIETIGAKNKTEALVIQIVATLFLLIYLLVSFITNAWNITWILWVVLIFVVLIVKLIFSMKGEKNEK